MQLKTNKNQTLALRTLFLRGHTNTQFTTVRAAVGEWFGGEGVETLVAAVEHGAQSLSLAGYGYSLQQDGRCVKGNDSTGKRTNQIAAALARNCTMCYNLLESIAAN